MIAKHIRLAGRWVAILLSLPACFCASAQPIKIAGTGAAVGAMELLIAEFRKTNPQLQFAPVEAIGSRGAIRALTADAIDAGLVDRPLTDAERSAGFQSAGYARTPLVLGVNRKVPLDAITLAHLADVLSGKIDQWPNGMRVRFILREVDDTNTKLIKGLAPAVASGMEQALRRPGMAYATTDRETDDLIESIPGAIGASTLGAIMSESRAVTVLALDGIKPSVQSLASGAYPLHKQLFVVWGKKELTPALRSFIAYLATSQAKDLLQRTGHHTPPYAER